MNTLHPQYPKRKEYPQNRYLQFCTRDELIQRFDDLLGNSIRFTDEGQAVLQDADHKINLLEHVMHEFSLRGETHLHFPAMRNLHFDDAKYPNARHAASLWRQHRSRCLPAGYLLKFGERKYLEPLLTKGEIRIRSASSYRDERLPLAIRDNEVQVVQVIGPVRFSKIDSDFYLSSFAARFENRLFDDFRAEACLIIHDVNVFGARVAQAFGARMPGWAFRVGSVTYFDPLRPPLNDDISFTKHFRYSYQTELRFVWTPPEPTIQLQPDHLDLELGDLSMFCELIVL